MERVASFRWTFVNFPEMTRDQGDAMGNEPITSDHYGCEGHTWRGLFRSNVNCGHCGHCSFSFSQPLIQSLQKLGEESIISFHS